MLPTGQMVSHLELYMHVYTHYTNNNTRGFLLSIAEKFLKNADDFHAELWKR